MQLWFLATDFGVAQQADDVQGMERGATASHAAREGVQELLALVEEERNRMSKAVLNSADGLSSAVLP
eukprot:337415-Rhodomonas_salina.2